MKTARLLQGVSSLFIGLLLTGFDLGSPSQKPTKSNAKRVIKEIIQRANPPIPIFSYNVINTYPHDVTAFTQGLVFHQGALYESTGLRKQSGLRKIDLTTGSILNFRPLADKHFGEGLTVWDEKLIQLTWRAQKGFVYDKESFAKLREFSYQTEGWGLTQDNTCLIMSDGSATLRFFNPENFNQIRQFEVRAGNLPVPALNELEFIQGEIYANIWNTDYIARISPKTGEVVGLIDLSRILDKTDRTQQTSILNGIAYDAETDRLFVTGKRWPKLFEIELVLQGRGKI